MFKPSFAFAFRLTPLDSFPSGKIDSTPGFDPIIGQNNGGTRFVSGLDPADPNHDFTLLFEFVRSRGGEYFFSPSLSALLDPISV